MVRLAPALLMLALAACSASPAREVVRARPTIVSLNPCTDAILAEVADPAQVLAISAWSHDPAASSMDLAVARRYAATRGTVEEVAALRPDLVVDGTFTAPATAQALQRLGLRLEQVPIAATVEDSRAQVRRLAALAGHPERGEALLRRIDAALDAARSEGRPQSALVWQAGGMVAGEGTLVSDVLARTGFANAAAARGLRQADQLPLERLIAEPPQVILAAGDPRSNEDRMLGHPALRKLAGTRVERLDSRLLYCGGPTIERLAARLAEVREGLGTTPQPPPLKRRGSMPREPLAPSSSEEGVGGGGVTRHSFADNQSS